MGHRILVVIGTRPEAIKLAPVIKRLAAERPVVDPVICITAQHREMLDDVLRLFEIAPDFEEYFVTGSHDDAAGIFQTFAGDPRSNQFLHGFITTPGYNDELAAFLRDDIGSAAQPFLEETARDHPNPAIRGRAANELRRYR